MAQRSVLAQSNGSPKTSVSTAVSTVLAHPPGKTRVYLQKTRYTREIPGSASMPRAPTPRAPAPTAARTACSSTRTAPCALATSAKGSIGAAPGAAGRWRCGRCGRADILLQAPPWAGGSTGESTRWRSGRAPSLRTPLATPRGRACHRSTRLLLASTPYRTPPTRVHRQFALLAVCRCILVLEDQLACSTSKRAIVAVHRAAASLSTAQRARGRVPCGWRDNSGLW